MMPEAFVLFKTELTHEREVYLTLSDHDGVAEVHALYGEFDLLVASLHQFQGTLSPLDGIVSSH